MDIEQTFCDNLKISELPFISPSIKHHKCFKSINISSSLTAWWEFLKITNSSIFPCNLTPIWNNPDILQNKKMLNFTSWKSKGIKHMEHIVQGGKFISFDMLKALYGINSNKFLEYQQLKAVINKKYMVKQIELQLPCRVAELLKICSPRYLSKIYRLLSKIDDSMSLPTSKWETDLSLRSDHNFWSQICSNTFRSLKNKNLQLIQYKILHRTHYTGQRMFKMGLTHTNICSQFTDNTPDDYIHALWSCAPVQRFWTEVCQDLSAWVGCDVPAHPTLCLLGNLGGTSIEANSAPIVLTALCIAKKTILVNWKTKEKLSINQFRNLLLDHFSIETMSASSNPQRTDTGPLWSSLIGSIT